MLMNTRKKAQKMSLCCAGFVSFSIMDFESFAILKKDGLFLIFKDGKLIVKSGRREVLFSYDEAPWADGFSADADTNEIRIDGAIDTLNNSVNSVFLQLSIEHYEGYKV